MWLLLLFLPLVTLMTAKSRSGMTNSGNFFLARSEKFWVHIVVKNFDFEDDLQGIYQDTESGPHSASIADDFKPPPPPSAAASIGLLDVDLLGGDCQINWMLKNMSRWVWTENTCLWNSLSLSFSFLLYRTVWCTNFIIFYFFNCKLRH